jgi:short-subunit dehydrogenase
MKKLGHGSIINVGSNSSMMGLAGYPAYVAAKAITTSVSPGILAHSHLQVVT